MPSSTVLRLALAGLLAICVLLTVRPAEAVAQEGAGRLEDLRAWAVPVRTLDLADEDFSDLAPLAEAIGAARIVQLGESTHGSGATFAAKARLIRFLHRELGFDVLAWESGLYDVRAVDDALRSGVDPAEAARLGVFGIWAASQEVLPVFEYARASHAGDRPLEMAGFDMQLSGRQVDDVEGDLLRFAGAVERAAVRDSATALARDVVVGFRSFDPQGENRPTPPDLERFLASADALLELFATRGAELAGPHGEREVAFMERVVGNLRELGINQYERSFAGRPADGPEARALQNRGWNRRDARMADNFLWLAEERYPDRKLIVWAHNGHIMNAHYRADWTALSHAPTDGGMKPMGVFLAEAMGDAVYTVGFTAFTGEYGLAHMPITTPIREAPAGSLEALLHQLGHDQAFLDFRALPPDHWLRQPATMAIRGYMPERMDDWTRVIDGVFFIDRMTPATPIER
jgi:erythromycin esterase